MLIQILQHLENPDYTVKDARVATIEAIRFLGNAASQISLSRMQETGPEDGKSWDPRPGWWTGAFQNCSAKPLWNRFWKEGEGAGGIPEALVSTESPSF